LNLRVNEQIRLSPVRLIDGEGNMRGIVPTDEAMRLARESGLDLVEVSPTERPPVCKIMDYGKYKYLQSKKTKQKHTEQKLKEVRLRPKTDEHDKGIKVNKARQFLEHGDRVQFTMMFRGRERAHAEIGRGIFDAVVTELQDIAKIESPARLMGKRMIMVLMPGKPVPAAKKPKPAAPAKLGERPVSGAGKLASGERRLETVGQGLRQPPPGPVPPAAPEPPPVPQPASTAEAPG
jgi:translation initiation factor IF-3